MDAPLKAFVLLLFAALSKADSRTGPELINATEIEIKYARLYWNYTPIERVFRASDDDRQPGSESERQLGYRFLIPSAERLSGITYVGHAARLRLVLERARSGEALRVGALGGSITAGHGVGGGEHTYVQHFMDWLNVAMPPHTTSPSRTLAGASSTSGRALRGLARGRDISGGGCGLAGLPRGWRRGLLRSRLKHRFLNGAVPGTQSGYTSSCLTNHVIPAPDLVFVEFAINDTPLGNWGEQDSPRRPLERLFRKLLSLPSQPAVVLVNMFAPGPSRSVYWNTAERDFMEFATYYGLPTVSLKAAVLPHSFSGTTEQVAWKAIFNGGLNHPGRGGHVVVTELLITLCLDLLRLDSSLTAAAAAAVDGEGSGGAASDGDFSGEAAVGCGGSAAPMTLEELRAVAARPLPPPLFPGNFGATSDTCYIEDQLQALVMQPVVGWTWTDENRGKWGYVATEPDQTIRLKVSTVVGGNGTEGIEPPPIILQVSYLQSYRGMGTARFRCESGCSCTPVTLDAYDPRPVSVAYVTDVQVSQHPECVLALTSGKPSAEALRAAGDATQAGAGSKSSQGQGAEYKFKLAGIVVGEDPGASEGTVSFVRGNSADILKRVQAIGRAYTAQASGEVDEGAARAADAAFGHGGRR